MGKYASQRERQLRRENDRLRSQLDLLQRQREHEYYEAGPSYFQMVKHFHEVYGLAISDTPLDLTESIKEGLYDLREALNKEEWQELCDAYDSYNLVEIADATCDLIYVLCGMCVSFGIPLDACFAEVQRSNMSKLGEDDKPIKREDGKILKGPNWSPPNLRRIIYGH